jgi:hypothetical protein
VTSEKTITLSPSGDSLLHEMHSVATLAPLSPPNTVLSVVIWMKSSETPLPRNSAEVRRAIVPQRRASLVQ